jgi:hypothetical protein
MKKRLIAALCAYAVLAVMAGITLEGLMRTAVWIFLAGLALKTAIAYRAGWSMPASEEKDSPKADSDV